MKIASVVLYINCLSRGIIDSPNCLQIKSLLKMQRILSIRIYQNGIHVCIVG